MKQTTITLKDLSSLCSKYYTRKDLERMSFNGSYWTGSTAISILIIGNYYEIELSNSESKYYVAR